MRKRLLSLLLAALMLCSLAPGALAVLTPELSGNVYYQSYHDASGLFSRWAMPVWSYLHPCTEGMERVEYIPHGSGVKLVAEQYSMDGAIVGRTEIPIELPLFGGFFAGRRENFVVFGREQSTKTGDDSEEVIRVVRYSKTWERLDSASIYGNNTTVPFNAGSLRMTEDDAYLYVHTAHEMYQTESGVNHQASLTFVVRKSDLAVTDIRSSVMNDRYGYVSHSFNQFVALDEGRLVTLDHGDAGPRAAYLYRCDAADQNGKCLPSFYNDKRGEGVNLMTFNDSGYNETGANLGGLAATSTHYLVAGSSVDQTADGVDLDDGQRNVFLAAVPKDRFSQDAVRLDWLTDYEDTRVYTPQLVQVSRDRCLLLWRTGEGMRYVFLKADGTPESEIYTADALPSDCAPTVIDGKIWWYVTRYSTVRQHNYFVYFGENNYSEGGDVPTFCCIDPAQPGTVREMKATNEVIPPHEHQIIVRNAAEPTCNDYGYTGDKVCEICGEVVEEGSIIGALGHNWVTNGAEKATCETDGSTGETACTRCGYVLRESTTIPALGHQLEWRNCKDPTCTEQGYSGDTYCRRCDKLLEYGAVTPALGHDWNEGFQAAEPTLTHDGIWRRTCSRCGDIHDEPIPKLDCAHDYQDAVVAPTCTESGYTRHVCRFCGAEYRDSFTAPAHRPVRQNARNAHCESEGYTGDLVCDRCNLLLEAGKIIPALGHEPVLRHAQAPTCTRVGQTGESYCERCNKYLSGGEEIPALGHDWSDWKVTKPATADAEGLETRTCTRCGEEKSRTIGRLKPDPTPAPPANPFTDVPKGEYYYDPVLWAVNHDPQITNGTSKTTFSPNATCTRGQVVTFLWRAMGCPEPKSTRNPFTDVKSGDYYYKPVLWAVENGITNGTSATAFSPNNPCTRAHVVTFLWRAHGEPAAGRTNPFSDVPGGQYYTDAVLWAVSKNITNGTSETAFSPAKPCTRGQIVTFLYRDLGQ